MAEEKAGFVSDPDQPTIVMTRVFNAPRRLVFEVFTRPDYVVQWVGPRGDTATMPQSELKFGGRYQLVTRDPKGAELGFQGEFRDIVRPEKLVYTWSFEGKEVLITNVFEERNGKTTLTRTTEFPTVADRDGLLGTGSNEAAAQSMDRAAELLRTLT